MRHLGLIYALASVAVLACSAVSRAVGSAIDRASAFVREVLDLFTPDAPRFATDGVALVRSIDGQPLDSALVQSLRYESPAGRAATR